MLKLKKKEREEKVKILNANKPFLIGISVIFAIYSLTLIFPFIWLFVNSLKTKFEFIDNPMAFPKTLEWKNYVTMFSEFNLATMFLNTILMATIIPTVQLFITAGVAYVCAKFKSVTGKICYLCAMVQIYVVISGTLPTTYKMMADLGLLDSLLGLVFMGSGGLNFSFLLLFAIFQNISTEYKEAAEIDGAGNWRIFLQIYFPQVFTVILAHWLLAFIGQWNNYVAPKLFWPSAFTLATGIQNISNRIGSGVFAMEYPKLFAAMIITIIPVLLIFICFQGPINKMNAGGGIKG